jgi:hypothetical protein
MPKQASDSSHSYPIGRRTQTPLRNTYRLPLFPPVWVELVLQKGSWLIKIAQHSRRISAEPCRGVWDGWPRELCRAHHEGGSDKDDATIPAVQGCEQHIDR